MRYTVTLRAVVESDEPETVESLSNMFGLIHADAAVAVAAIEVQEVQSWAPVPMRAADDDLSNTCLECFGDLDKPNPYRRARAIADCHTIGLTPSCPSCYGDFDHPAPAGSPHCHRVVRTTPSTTK